MRFVRLKAYNVIGAIGYDAGTVFRSYRDNDYVSIRHRKPADGDADIQFLHISNFRRFYEYVNQEEETNMKEPIKVGNRYRRESTKEHPHVKNGDIITVTSDRRRGDGDTGTFNIAIVAESDGWSTETSEDMLYAHYVLVGKVTDEPEPEPPTVELIPQEVAEQNVYERQIAALKHANKTLTIERDNHKAAAEERRREAVQEEYGEVNERFIWRVRASYVKRNWTGRKEALEVRFDVITAGRDITEAAIAAEARMRYEYDNDVRINEIKFERDIAAVKPYVNDSARY